MISYVQSAYSEYPPSAPKTSIAVNVAGAQTAGDINIVMISWWNLLPPAAQSTIQSVTDTKGNIYTLAVGPTTDPDPTLLESHAIYYAKNIVAATAGANTINIIFSDAVEFPDVRMAEYSGIDTTSPFNIGKGTVGNSSTPYSGSVATTSANALLVGGDVLEATTTGPGTGFTQRILTPGMGNIFEDKVVSATGSYSATANADSVGNWVMQIGAFKRASGATSITFKQARYSENPPPSSSTTSTTLKIPGAQTAGNLNGVIISWWNPLPPATLASISSISDTKGNVYTLAVGPTTDPDTTLLESQSIYYAKNIAAATANSNTITVTFNKAVDYPNIRFAEYKGLDATAPFNVGAGAVGTTANLSSGSVTTTAANALLIGGSVSEEPVTTPGANYTSRLITNLDGNILEDRIVSTTGSYSATSTAAVAGHSVMQIAAFKAGDTQAPTAPSGLTATAVSTTQVNLTWTASTDNIGVRSYLIERCQGSGCTSFVQIASVTGAPPTVSYSDVGLTPSTAYSYQVRASDAVDNLSATYSNTATATTVVTDTTLPISPTTVAPTANSNSQITVTWSGATDNVGVTGYILERCSGVSCSTFTQVATPTASPYVDTGLTSSTSYSYRLKAKDAAGNVSAAYSPTGSATTQTPSDTTPPTAPTSVTATANSSAQITVSWSGATDNIGVTGYLLERCSGVSCSTFAQIATPSASPFVDTGLAGSTIDPCVNNVLSEA